MAFASSLPLLRYISRLVYLVMLCRLAPHLSRDLNLLLFAFSVPCSSTCSTTKFGGHYNDADMLLAGNDCITLDEARTQMSVWSTMVRLEPRLSRRSCLLNVL